MAASATKTNIEEAGVFELLTELCSKTASKYCAHNTISQNRLTSKMRSHSYELILHKTAKENQPSSSGEPIGDLLSYYFISQKNAKTTAEYKKTLELKRIISTIRQSDFGEDKENVFKSLRLIVGLSDSIKDDVSSEMFQKPFSFGLLDEMLPKPMREAFGSAQPYSYFPSKVFELPYSLKNGATLSQNNSQTYTEYTVETFDSKSFLSDKKYPGQINLKTFRSPMSLASLASTNFSPYSENTMFNYPRLTAPRDILIPGSQSHSPNVKISLASTELKTEDVQEVYRAGSTAESVDIWELVTHVDKDIPDDIWEIVSKMPPIKERQLIATSPREIRLWRTTHEDVMSHLNIISEKQFIRHIMYLTIGVETNSFPYSQESDCFYMKENLVLEGISQQFMVGYVSELLIVGTYYKRLYNFAFNQTLEEHFHSNGLIYEAVRDVIRRYLLEFRLKATEMYEECYSSVEEINSMPTLLQILFHMEPLKYEIETIASIYKLINNESRTTLPYGAELMSYLFNEISLVTHRKTAITMFSSLFSVCQVYFKFIEKFIFEGELDDRYHEFFIRKDSLNVNCRSKRYWDKGFHITQSVAIPEFLRSLAKFILLCGKSLRLLKLCNPSDPLILLISSDHPSVKCCASFEELERQQQLLDVYRTRCLFVTGELVTFDQILLKREAERKAFTEMATIKQAETLEKIVAERKRLAQLIIAEKQHSLRVLEAAMAEAKAAKHNAKQREKKRHELEGAGDKATEEVDSRLRDDERNKIMEYYSKLNIEVEKKQMHTEWKIKRLQLDQSRMQLLSTEERNLKREKLEVEHQRSEQMAISIQSMTQQDETDNKNTEDSEETETTMTESGSSVVMVDVEEKVNQKEKKVQAASNVVSAICNVAKSFFGRSKSDENCDNKKHLDSQGNIIHTELNYNETKSSSDVIGANLETVYDNEQYQKTQEQALANKQKVMAHEFGQICNQIETPVINIDSFDEENNKFTPNAEAKRNKKKVLGTEYDLEPKVKCRFEPWTDAQKEAVINKQKVLGVEYNMPVDLKCKKEPVNIAQEEAVRNKKKVLASEYESISEHESSRVHESSIVEHGSISDEHGSRYDEHEARTVERESKSAHESRIVEPEITSAHEPRIVEHETKSVHHESRTIEHGSRVREVAKRSALTLNLRPYGETSYSLGLTPNASVTPGDLFPRLDLETPTTSDIPLEGAMTSEIFTPRGECSKDLGSEKKTDKDFLTSQGFNFIVDDVTADSEAISDIQTESSPENSPSKSTDIVDNEYKRKYSLCNILDGSYSLEQFDPFGIKEMKVFSKDYLNQKMNVDMSNSCYTHPAIIMEEVKKRPYDNIFAAHFGTEEEEHKITCDNIATLTACLQRSVMLPLTYQLEVVNNSILTYFLVNQDMYEHLRSLKDYFFLMDGEFSRSICHNLFAKLTKTLNPQELLNFSTLHNILDKALGSSISHVHKFTENLSFSISDTPLSFQHSSPDVLVCLSLTYAVSWPLNIILSQEALTRYAKVFQFLIKMRRIFWVLGEDFENLKLAVKLSRQHSRKLLRSPQYVSVQIYRHVMASMIRALDNYIVTTCILSSWTEFEKDLKKARTLDDLYECHVVYIKKVLFRCLLNNRSTPVMKLLNDIFTVVLKFSRVLKAGEWHQNEPNGAFTHTSFAQLQELFHLFEKLAKYLHKVVTKLMECGYQRHLVELLTMVNLNGYYDPERSKEEHNTSF